MDKERVSSIIRYLLSALGAYLIGHQLWGTTVTPEIWQEWLGAVVAIISVVWGFVDKTVTLEAFQGALRQVIAIAGGLAVAKGLITAETFTTITGFVLSFSAWIYSFLSRQKSVQLARGQLSVAQLSGVQKHPDTVTKAA